MKELRYGSALAEALAEEMERDSSVFMMGQDIETGGSFKSTVGLYEKFGPDRIRNTPISEDTVAGAAVGAAIRGMRPVVEFLFCDFSLRAMDQIGNQAAKYRYMTGGQVNVPLVFFTSVGIGASRAAHHSQNLEGVYRQFPGLKIALPSTSHDVKGLLKAAIRDDNPVFFIEAFALYPQVGQVPETEYVIPLGQADVKREGRDVTVVALSAMVPQALAAADQLAAEGIEVEVVDPRTIVPLDHDAITRSVQKTGRMLVVETAPRQGGVGGEIITSIMEDVFDYLDAPPIRLAAPDTPIPFAPQMERFVMPGRDKIVAQIREMAG